MFTYHHSMLKKSRWLYSFSITLLCLLSMNVWAQETTVRGKITSSDANEPLVGVNVVVKGTTIGTITDIQGVYTLNNVPQGAFLLFSYVGYLNQETEVGGRSTIDISMAPDSKLLEEIVVVGYGEQKKGDVTGSIASVSSKALLEVPAANLTQALQSRAAGLEIQRVGTQPGAGAQIRIRGERSISGSNDPLIVLNGIPYQGSINDINPDEIQSVEVLKDASATAIYGSRGANGVIIVTTKKGIEGPTRIDLNSYYGVSSVARKYDVYSAEEYRTMRDISTWSGGYMPEELESIETGRTTDWQDLMYEKGYITNHNLSISGGSASGYHGL
jgi:TonB-dependent starch-binding outer membrane protein SusC